MPNRPNGGGESGGPAKTRGAKTSAVGKAGKKKRRPVRAPQTRPWGWIAAFTAIGVLCAGGITYAALSRGSGNPGNQASADIPGVQTYSDLSREHTRNQVDYAQQPPPGGRHNPIWVPCNGRVYSEPVPNENAVHSLEHGTVWITYRPGLPADQRQALAERVRGQRYMMMSPYPGQPAPIVLTAWGHQLTVSSASDDRVDTFADFYNQGPQTPEPGASCEAGRMS